MRKKQHLKAFSLIELSVVIIIIGILVIGITQGSRIIKNSKLQAAVSLTKSSPVNSISNLVFWLDVTDTTTISSSAACATSPDNYGIVSNGYFVNKWDDKNPQSSSKIRTAVAANTDCPTYVDSGIGGLPTISFDGASDSLQSLIGAISNGNKNFSIFAVIRKTTTNAMVMYFSQFATTVGFTGGATDASMIILGTQSAGNIYPEMVCGGSGGNCYSEKSGIAGSATNPYVMATILNGSNLYATHYVNNIVYQGNSGIFTNFGVGNGLMLIGSGRGSSTNNQFFAGYISEIIVFDRTLKSSEILSVNDYLMRKYSIK
jgi:prepilin-type N-terminal cleavage/methylation domain-containing protein